VDAGTWADLADALAAAAGNDLTAGRDAIMHALEIDPKHRKALWLRASLELQEGRYATAAATWRELHPLVAAGSTDARVIAANIAEADALAAAHSIREGG
jgi:cytochrome c-type biogenesis protein CcmH